MAMIHEVRWSNDEMGIIQADGDLLVCHMACGGAPVGGRGYWRLTKATESGWWRCAGGPSCGYTVFNDGTKFSRVKIESASEDAIAWWVASWAGVSRAEVEVSIE